MNPMGLLDPKQYSKKMAAGMAVGGWIASREDIPVLYRGGALLIAFGIWAIGQSYVDAKKAMYGRDPSTASNGNASGKPRKS